MVSGDSGPAVDGQERRLLKVMTWKDGVAVALVASAAGLTTIGPSIVALGAWAAVLLWAVSVFIGGLQTRIFSEMSAMFPEKSGGLALYANQGWRRYSTIVGPISTFGYWFGWSVALAVVGLVIGELVQAQWFPHATWTFWDGTVHVGLPQLIAAAAIILVWLVNVLGVRMLVRTSYLLGVMLIIPVALLVIVPVVTGNWSASRLHWGLSSAGSPLTVALVWMYLMGWTSYGMEICASFAPEFRDTKRDTWRALKGAGIFTFGYYVLVVLAVGGTATTAVIVASPSGFYGPLLGHIVDGIGGVITVFLVGALILVMNSSTADGGRALYGMAKDGLTVKQLGHLNRAHVPARAMTLDLVVNLLLVFFVANPIAVLLAGNLGYFIALIFALTGFLLLRKDRPTWPRPIKLGKPWLGIAAALSVFNLVLLVLAALNPSITGYGNTADLLIGVGILLVSLLLYGYRRIVQDGGRIAWRDTTPDPEPELEPEIEAERAARVTTTLSS